MELRSIQEHGFTQVSMRRDLQEERWEACGVCLCVCEKQQCLPALPLVAAPWRHNMPAPCPLLQLGEEEVRTELCRALLRCVQDGRRWRGPICMQRALGARHAVAHACTVFWVLSAATPKTTSFRVLCSVQGGPVPAVQGLPGCPAGRCSRAAGRGGRQGSVPVCVRHGRQGRQAGTWCGQEGMAAWAGRGCAEWQHAHALRLGWFDGALPIYAPPHCLATPPIDCCSCRPRNALRLPPPLLLRTRHWPALRRASGCGSWASTCLPCGCSSCRRRLRRAALQCWRS